MRNPKNTEIAENKNRIIKNTTLRDLSPMEQSIERIKSHGSRYDIASILVMAMDYRIGIRIDYWNFQPLDARAKAISLLTITVSTVPAVVMAHSENFVIYCFVLDPA